MSRGVTLSRADARRLSLARAGLLRPEWTGLPARVRGRGAADANAVRDPALAHVSRHGYLQLDTVCVAGARSHSLVLASRLERFPTRLTETLLGPDAALFEYWGHEASWIPMDLYPAFGFRREQFTVHPWWGDILSQRPGAAKELLDRIRRGGPLRSSELEGKNRGGFWNLSFAKKLVSTLWSSGELSVCERRGFQRTFDLTERVVPRALLGRSLPLDEALKVLLLRALDGHGWATRGTLAATWRLRNKGPAIRAALAELEEDGAITACGVLDERAGTRTSGREIAGWIRTRDLDLVARLRRARPRGDRGVLLSPFDPVLWDRPRVRLLFDFDQILEIFKPAAQRKYGYYCMPVLAGDRLVARVDLKADRRANALTIRARHDEPAANKRARALQREAVVTAVRRHAAAVELPSPL